MAAIGRIEARVSVVGIACRVAAEPIRAREAGVAVVRSVARVAEGRSLARLAARAIAVAAVVVGHAAETLVHAEAVTGRAALESAAALRRRRTLLATDAARPANPVAAVEAVATLARRAAAVMLARAPLDAFAGRRPLANQSRTTGAKAALAIERAARTRANAIEAPKAFAALRGNLALLAFGVAARHVADAVLAATRAAVLVVIAYRAILAATRRALAARTDHPTAARFVDLTLLPAIRALAHAAEATKRAAVAERRARLSRSLAIAGWMPGRVARADHDESHDDEDVLHGNWYPASSASSYAMSVVSVPCIG